MWQLDRLHSQVHRLSSVRSHLANSRPARACRRPRALGRAASVPAEKSGAQGCSRGGGAPSVGRPWKLTSCAAGTQPVEPARARHTQQPAPSAVTTGACAWRMRACALRQGARQAAAARGEGSNVPAGGRAPGPCGRKPALQHGVHGDCGRCGDPARARAPRGVPEDAPQSLRSSLQNVQTLTRSRSPLEAQVHCIRRLDPSDLAPQSHLKTHLSPFHRWWPASDRARLLTRAGGRAPIAAITARLRARNQRRARRGEAAAVRGGSSSVLSLQPRISPSRRVSPTRKPNTAVLRGLRKMLVRARSL